jgi:hypothetical protein
VAESVIADAVVAAGHDGQAQLVVQIRHENGAIGSVTLEAEWAFALIEACGVDSAEGLRGQPWQRLLDLMQDTESRKTQSASA